MKNEGGRHKRRGRESQINIFLQKCFLSSNHSERQRISLPEAY